MKKLFFLLSLTTCLTLPALSQAQTQGVAEGRSVNSKIVGRDHALRSVPRHQVIYYITSTARTGSLIPMVYRRYDNRLDSASNAAVYGSQAIEATGTLDVSTALYKLDPSFTSHR